jgi:hypothetical protein
MFRSLSVRTVIVVSVIARASVAIRLDPNRLNGRDQRINTVEWDDSIMRLDNIVLDNVTSKK